MAILKAALQEAYSMELAGMSSEEELIEDKGLTFSPAFERKMKKLIRRTDHPIRYRVAQIAACLLLAALLSGCTALAISPEVRAAFVGWVRETYEIWFVYKYEGEDQELPKDTEFQITWLPEGFVEVEHSASKNQSHTLYLDGNNNFISFIYTRSMESATLFIEESEVGAQTVQIGDLYADLYLGQRLGGANALVWYDRGALFGLQGNCSSEELIKIAESVKAVQLKQSADEVQQEHWTTEFPSC